MLAYLFVNQNQFFDGKNIGLYGMTLFTDVQVNSKSSVGLTEFLDLLFHVLLCCDKPCEYLTLRHHCKITLSKHSELRGDPLIVSSFVSSL